VLDGEDEPMRRWKLYLGIAALGLLGVALCLILRPKTPDARPTPAGPPQVGPDASTTPAPSLRDKFARLRTGIGLAEVEAVLGPAGPSYASEIGRQYYIWKGGDGWIRVWVVQDKVEDLELDTSPWDGPKRGWGRGGQGAEQADR
jgi:hypothetical protein